jgi:hypothetical protein
VIAGFSDAVNWTRDTYPSGAGLKAEDDNLSHIDEDMIMVMAGKIITERMEVLENEMTKQFDAKLKILMEEQYHNKEKINAQHGILSIFIPL